MAWKHKIVCCLLSAWIFLFSLETLNAGSLDINGRVSHAREPSSENINSANIAKALSLKFTPSRSSVLHIGKSDQPYWVRLDLSSLQNQLGETWILELATYKVNEISVFYPTKTGEWIERKGGMAISDRLQDAKGRNYVFLIKDADLGSPLLIRASAVYLRIPVHIWTLQDFLFKEQRQILLDGCFYGIVVTIICYQLFMFLALRNRAYLHYAVFLALVLLWYLAGGGWLFLFLARNLPPALSGLAVVLNPLLGGLLIFAGIQFTRSYLKIASYDRRLDRVLQIFLWLLVALGTTGVLLIASENSALFVYLYNFGFVVIAVVIALCFYAGVKGYLEKQVTARYYLIAISIQFLVSIVMMLSMFEVLPFNFEWRILQGCSVIEMLIFSYGLSKQVKQLNEEKEEVSRELITAKEKMISQLETINDLKDRVLSRVMESRQYPEFARLFSVLGSVVYIQAVGNASRVVFLAEGIQQEIEIQVGLKDIEKCFDNEHFMRIHKTYLVKQGLNFTLQRRSSADYDMVTRHFVLPVGRKYIKSVREQSKG